MIYSKYLSVLPLFANLLIIYVAYPIISSSSDIDFATQSILILSFFSMISSMHFGIPILIVRSYKNNTNLGKLFINTIFLGIIFSILASYYYLFAVDQRLLWLIVFVPAIILTNYIRGIWEAKQLFLKSYFIRMLILSAFPLAIIYIYNLQPDYLTTICVISVFFSLWFFYKNLSKLKEIGASNGPNNTLPFIALFLQFIYTFIFIFSDRFFLVNIISDQELAFFVKEYEMIYRFATPMIFIGSILYPGLSSIDKKEATQSFRELLFFLIIWVFFSALIPYMFKSFYLLLNFSTEAKFFAVNAFYISVTVFLIGISALMHRIILALCSYKVILICYLTLTLVILIISFYSTYSLYSAIMIILYKSIAEVLVLSIFLTTTYINRKKISFNLFRNVFFRRALYILLNKYSSSDSLHVALFTKDHISNEILSDGSYEKPFIIVLKKLLKDIKSQDYKNTHIIDVGANIGNHSINLSKSVDKIIAIEPNPSCVMLLRASLIINNIKNVEVVPMGVSSIKETLTLRFIKDHIGSGTFMKPQSGGGAQKIFNKDLKKLNGLDNSEIISVKVDADNLDNILKEILPEDTNIKLIKIDVEGYEKNIIEGAKTILKQYSPLITFEAHGLDNFNEIQNELNKHGYISFYNLVQSRRSHDLFIVNVFNMIFRPHVIKVRKILKAKEDINYQMVIASKKTKNRMLDSLCK